MQDNLTLFLTVVLLQIYDFFSNSHIQTKLGQSVVPHIYPF